MLCPTRYCPLTAPRTVSDRPRGLLYDSPSGTSTVCCRASGWATSLPPIGERWGGFGDAADSDRVKQRVLGALDFRTHGLQIGEGATPMRQAR